VGVVVEVVGEGDVVPVTLPVVVVWICSVTNVVANVNLSSLVPLRCRHRRPPPSSLALRDTDTDLSDIIPTDR